MRLDRILLLVAASTLLNGCFLFAKLNPDCHSPQEYRHALSAAPLKVPAGMDSPNTTGALVIPAVTDAPPPPGPHDTCFDIPPRYVPAPSSRAASG